MSLLLGAWLWNGSAAAQPRRPTVTITYAQAVALARERAPSLVAARARAREAESEGVGASVWRFNPQLSAAAGPRFQSSGAIADWSVGAQQWLELGGQRPRRVEAARAGALAGAARGEDVQRLLVRDVGVGFISALYWQRRIALAEENLRIADAIARVAARRHELGDVGGLDAAVSALAVVRSRGELDRARAALVQAEGRLKALLGLDAAIALRCQGELRQLGTPGPATANPRGRADLRALRAEMRQSEAEAALGRASRAPNLALGARYGREEGEDLVQGTLTVGLPLLDRGQGATARAEARRARLRAELDAASKAAAAEIQAARAVAEQLNAAADRFEAGLGTLARAERLASASYEAGAIPLGELLAVRRELVQAKVDYAELLLAAAIARTELAASLGSVHPTSER